MEEEYLGKLKKDYVGQWRNCKISPHSPQHNVVQDHNTGERKCPKNFSRTVGYDVKYQHVRKTLPKGATEMRRHGHEGTQLWEGADICTTNVWCRHLCQKRIHLVGGEKEEDKTWTKAKKSFGSIYEACKSYESDMNAHRSRFETANSFTQNPRNGSERSMAERSTDTSATKATA